MEERVREIKFRAWHKGQGSFPPQMFYDAWSGQCLYYSKEGQPVKVMQYTGLKDKNGKEIYEGDIVAFEVYNNTKKIWEIECRLPVAYYGDRFCAYVKDHIHALNFLPNHIKVIGNIYENPELLS